MGKTAAAEKAKPEGKTKKVVRLDFENIEVKRMIVAAKKSGLLHVDELNKHLVIDGISAEEIEILYAQLSDRAYPSMISVMRKRLGRKPSHGPRQLRSKAGTPRKS